MKLTEHKVHIIGILIIACFAMAFVDTLWQPGYIVKSMVKLSLFLLLPLLYSKFRKDVSYKYLFRFDWRHFGISVAMGIAVFVFILLAYRLIGPYFDFSSVTASLEKETGITRESFIFIAIYISFVNALLEEFFFRGFAYLELKKWVSKRKAIIISAGAFSLYHVAIMINWFSISLFALLLTSLFLGGILFNLINERSNNIYSSWMVHMFANFAINAVGLILFTK